MFSGNIRDLAVMPHSQDQDKSPGDGQVYGGAVGYPLGQGVSGGISPMVRLATSREQADDEEKLAHTLRMNLEEFIRRPSPERGVVLDNNAQLYVIKWMQGRVRVL